MKDLVISYSESDVSKIERIINQLKRFELPFHIKETTTANGRPSTEKQALLDFINQDLKALKDNWDGYGAVAVEPAVLKNVHFLIDSLPNVYLKFLTKDKITPTANGTMTLNWETDSAELFLEIGNANATYYVKNGDATVFNNRFNIHDEHQLLHFHQHLKENLF